MRADPWMAYLMGVCSGVMATCLLVTLAAWWGL